MIDTSILILTITTTPRLLMDIFVVLKENEKFIPLFCL